MLLAFPTSAPTTMVLDELDLSALEAETTTDHVKKTIALLFWMWYASNQDRKLLVIRKWFISKTIYVRDLEDIFEILFGTRNAST